MILVPNVDGNASVDQSSHNIEVPVLRCGVHWIPAGLGINVDIGTLLD
jgi:hypothetical protein